MLWLLVQGLRLEKCQLLKVSRMKHTQIIITHSDAGVTCDSDGRIIVPISLTIFFQFLDVGRRKSWWSTTGMEPWRKESPADSMEKLASLRRWCIWWTRGRQRPQTSSWRQTRHGTCRMWIWRLGCSAYFMALEINHHWGHNRYRELGHFTDAVCYWLFHWGSFFFSIKFSIPFLGVFCVLFFKVRSSW